MNSNKSETDDQIDFPENKEYNSESDLYETINIEWSDNDMDGY
jgi:hypothetical protein